MVRQAPQLLELLGPAVSDPVTREHNKIGSCLPDSLKRFPKVGIIHLRADVQIGQMSQCAPGKFPRQTAHWKQGPCDLQPVGFDSPGVEANERGTRSCSRQPPQQLPPGNFSGCRFGLPEELHIRFAHHRHSESYLSACVRRVFWALSGAWKETGERRVEGDEASG